MSSLPGTEALLPLAHQRYGLLVGGEAARPAPLEEPPAVDGEREHPAGALDELCAVPRLPLDRRRQPGGLRTVVSDAAVLDRDLHRSPSRRAPGSIRRSRSPVMSRCEACAAARPPMRQITCGDSCRTPVRSATASESGRSSLTRTSTQRTPVD